MSNAAGSLYERLGGYDVIAKIMVDLTHRVRADPKFVRFGGGRSTENLKRNDQLTIEYVCMLAGGPVHYLGRDMKISHAGLKITQDEWKASMRHLADALDAHGVAPTERAEVLALFAAMEREIVEVP